MYSIRPLPIVILVLVMHLIAACSKSPEDHAEIARTNPDYETALASLNSLQDETLIADIAANAANTNIQKDALGRLTDETLLADLAKKTKSTSLADLAMEKITDPRLLSDIAANAKLTGIRIQAAKAPEDNPLLADIILKSRDWSDQRKALDKLDDQPLLAKIVKNSRDKNTRMQALKKINDQSILINLAGNSNPLEIRKEVIQRMNDQKTLLDIAKNDSRAELRGAAAARLSDQQALAEIAMDDVDESVRVQAVEALKDQALLLDIIKSVTSDESPNLRPAMTAVGRIKDQNILADLTVNFRAISIASEAVTQLNDQELLGKIAKDTALVQSIRWEALNKLTDQKLLAEIAEDKKDESLREEAVHKLTDQTLLAHIARTNDNSKVALAALKKVLAQDLLADIASNTKDENTLEEAIGRITDPPLLATLARNDSNENLRLLAIWQLDNKETLSGLAETNMGEATRKALASKLSEAPIKNAEGNITDMIGEGKILVSIKGGGVRNLGVNIKKMTPYPLDILIPAGTFFVSESPFFWTLSTEETKITLNQKQRNAEIPIVFINLPKSDPDASVRFKLDELPEGKDIHKIKPILGRKDVSHETKQALAWIVEENADYGKLSILRLIPQNSIPIPFVTPGERAINEPEAARAMQLCEEVGINIKEKRIWNDKKGILAGLQNGDVKNWLKITGDLKTPAHQREVTALQLSPDGTLLASGDNDGWIKLWSMPDGKLRQILKGHHSTVTTLAFSPDGKLLASGSLDHSMILWSLPGGRQIKTERFEAPGDYGYETVEAITFSPDGKFLAAAGSGKEIKLWSLTPLKLLKTLASGESGTDSLAFNQDSTLLAAGSLDNNIYLWKISEGALEETLQGHKDIVEFVAFTPDGKLLSADRKKNIRLWTPAEKQSLVLGQDKLMPGALSRDGKYFVGVDRTNVRVFQFPDKKIITSLEKPLNTWSLTINPDSTILITGDGDWNITLWNLLDGKLIKTLEGD